MLSTTAADVEAKATAIFASQRITKEERTFLMSAFQNGDIDKASEALINKIYDALAAGKISIVE